MKRTKEKTEIEIENEERQAIYANHITTAMRDQGHRFVINPSFASVEDLNFGRMAFLGMNPAIEKVAADERVRQEEIESQKMEKDVQDEDMAAHFAMVRNKFAKGNNNPTFDTAAARQSSSSSSKFKVSSTSPARMSESDAQQLLAQGGKLLNQIKSQNKVWKKKNHFLKPKE